MLHIFFVIQFFDDVMVDKDLEIQYYLMTSNYLVKIIVTKGLGRQILRIVQERISGNKIKLKLELGRTSL